METIKNIFHQTKGSKLYLPILALLAFITGYLLMYPIVRFEIKILAYLPQFPNSGILLSGFIEQSILFALAFAIFSLSKKYYLPMFLYAGFILQYSKLLYDIHHLNPYPSILFYLFPAFVYSLLVIVLTIGFKFGKRGSFLALITCIIFLGAYNYMIANTDFASYIGQFLYRITG